MTSTQIRCFLTVAGTMSFSKAAEALYMAQSAVSRQIIRLEEELGAPLFIRSGKTIALTDQGQDYFLFFSKAREALSDMRRAHAAGSERAAAVLRYAAFPVWNITNLLCENAELIRRRHPEWSLHMEFCGTNNMLSGLRSGKVDVIFHLENVCRDMAGIDVYPLMEVDQIIIFAGDYFKDGRANPVPEDFKNETFLFAADDVFTDRVMDELHENIGKRYGFRPKVQKVDDADALVFMLEQGRGVAQMDAWSRIKENKALRHIAAGCKVKIVSACGSYAKSPAVEAFIGETAAFLRENAGRLS